jgi:glyoxylase I family protein
MKITQYLHTAILVSDLSKAENFYGQVLGLTRVDRVLKYP